MPTPSPVSDAIKKHLKDFKPGDLFVTADLLQYGSRDAVDKVLWRMVKRNQICRVAHGTFAIPGKDVSITVEEIVEVRAKRFGKKKLGRLDDGTVVLDKGGHGGSFKVAGVEVKHTDKKSAKHQLTNRKK